VIAANRSYRAAVCIDEKHIMDAIITDIDERWMAEWVTFGMRELERYLGKHRCFEEYYSRRSQSLGAPALDR
jgi:hypothetical protein